MKINYPTMEINWRSDWGICSPSMADGDDDDDDGGNENSILHFIPWT